MGNCVRRETGLDLDEEESVQLQEMISNIVSLHFNYH